MTMKRVSEFGASPGVNTGVKGCYYVVLCVVWVVNEADRATKQVGVSHGRSR